MFQVISIRTLGPAGKSSTVTKLELPEDLLFKDSNKDLFKVQSIDNFECFYEYESAKTDLYVKNRLNFGKILELLILS